MYFSYFIIIFSLKKEKRKKDDCIIYFQESIASHVFMKKKKFSNKIGYNFRLQIGFSLRLQPYSISLTLLHILKI